MLNILVNDSFSTNKSGKIKKPGKGGKKNAKKSGAKEKKPKAASIMGYSALEVLQMKEAERKLNEKPTAKPIVYFKDFEKRFDDLIVQNKTPRQDTTIETNSPRGENLADRPELDCIAQKEETKAKKGGKKSKPERPMTPVFFQNFAPPKKAKKNTLASKKRYSSQVKGDG